MATFTIDELRKAADKKYAPTVIEAGDETYKLPTLLRLESDRRKQVIKLLEALETDLDGEDTSKGLEETLDTFRKLIAEVEENGKGQELVELIDDDVVLIDVVNAWLDGIQAGEA